MSLWIDKEKIARSFRRALSSYDEQAIIQKKVSDELVDVISEYPKISFNRVLEIGCCTGMMTKGLLDQFDITTLYINDLVPEFQQAVLSRFDENVKSRIIPVFGDIETETVPDNLDLVVSSATFQWIEDLDILFGRLAGSMKKNGHLVFTQFSAGTLTEFRQLINIGLHYYGEKVLSDILGKYFSIKLMRKKKDVLYFSTPRDVLKHFQETGVGGVSEYRWTTGNLNRFAKEYTKRFGTSKGVPVTYVSTLVVAEKR